MIGQTKLWRRDATRLGPCRGAPFNLIFADPPYGTDLGVRALGSALDGGWLEPGGVVVLEQGAGDAMPESPDLVLKDMRTYGETRLMIFATADLS